MDHVGIKMLRTKIERQEIVIFASFFSLQDFITTIIRDAIPFLALLTTQRILLHTVSLFCPSQTVTVARVSPTPQRDGQPFSRCPSPGPPGESPKRRGCGP